MLKKNLNAPVGAVIKDGVEYGYAYVLSSSAVDSIEGNLMAIIEGIGLPEKQELAIKSQARQTVYRPISKALFLNPQEFAEVGHSKGLKGSGNPSVLEIA